MGQKAFYQGRPLRPSMYVCGVDVMNGEMAGKIEEIDPRHEFWGKTIAIARLSTTEGVKMLRVGAEIEDSLVELFGADVTKWIGKSITLYFDPAVMFKGRKVGGARIRTNGQAPAAARPEPDAKGSGKLTGQIVDVIGKAGSLDELTAISEGIKKRAGDLTKDDTAIIRCAYKGRQDQLAAVPAEPETVDGSIDPVTGEVEQVQSAEAEKQAPETGEMFDAPPAEATPADDGIPDFGGPE